MSRITVGIDNGQSGSVGILCDNALPVFVPVPTQDSIHYGRRGSIGKRLDRAGLKAVLAPCVYPGIGESWVGTDNVRIYVERPFSGKFMNAVLPAHRFFEATIITLEDLGLGYEVVDSGPWQKSVLGNVSGSANLKRASKLRGQQIYPQFAKAIASHGDADGLLIAHFHHFLGTSTS